MFLVGKQNIEGMSPSILVNEKACAYLIKDHEMRYVSNKKSSKVEISATTNKNQEPRNSTGSSLFLVGRTVKDSCKRLDFHRRL